MCNPGNRARPLSFGSLAGFIAVAVAMVVGASPARAQCTNQWQGYGSPGFIGTVNTSIEFDDGTGTALFVGGSFSHIGGTNARNVAKWDGTEWVPAGTGLGNGSLNEAVNRFAIFDFGDGPRLVAAGRFAIAGSTSLRGLAVWNGNSWEPVPSELDDGVFPGGSWVELATAATLDDGNGPALYVAGNFRLPGGAINKQLAKWDGTQWVDLTGAATDLIGNFRDWDVFDDGSGLKVYLVGGFVPGPQNNPDWSRAGIVRWDGTDWEAVGPGFGSQDPPTFYDIEIFDDGSGSAIFLAGDIDLDPTSNTQWHGVLKLAGSSWVPVGTPGDFETRTRALQVVDEGGTDVLYAAGDGPNIDNVLHHGVARLDGSEWEAVDFGWFLDGASVTTRDLNVVTTVGGPHLIALGSNRSPLGVTMETVTEFDGSNWTTLDATSAFNAPVMDFHEVDLGSGPELFAAGAFTVAGGENTGYVARWDGDSWASFGQPVSGPLWTGSFTSRGRIVDLESFDFGTGPELVACGVFDHIGAAPAAMFAKWDGTSWTQLGSLTLNNADGMFVYDDGTGQALYAFGVFNLPGDQVKIVKWNGTSWQAASLGLTSGSTLSSAISWNDGTTDHLFVIGSNLRRLSDNASLGTVAHFNGTAWSKVDVTGSVTAALPVRLRVLDLGAGPKVYLIGRLTASPSSNSGGIAEWTGSAWSVVGAGTYTSIEKPLTGRDAAVIDDGSGRALILLTNFSSDGFPPGPKSYVAKWNGVSWYRFPIGFNQQPELCFGASVSGMDRVLVGNGNASVDFTSVEGLASRFFATWGPATPCFQARLGDRFANVSDQVVVAPELLASPSPVTYQWYRGAIPLTNNGRILGADSDTLDITSALSVDTGEYRLVATNECGTSESANLTLIVPGPPPCPGDVTGDGATNVSDFNVQASHFGQSVTPYTNGDLNGDGFVNVSDFNIMAGNFGCVP